MAAYFIARIIYVNAIVFVTGPWQSNPLMFDRWPKTVFVLDLLLSVRIDVLPWTEV